MELSSNGLLYNYNSSIHTATNQRPFDVYNGEQNIWNEVLIFNENYRRKMSRICGNIPFFIAINRFQVE